MKFNSNVEITVKWLSETPYDLRETSKETDNESKWKNSVTAIRTALKGPLYLLPDPGVFLLVNSQIGVIEKEWAQGTM